MIPADVIIVSGPPGSGKSTVARELAATYPRSACVVGDDFFGFLSGGAIEPWRPKAHDQNETVVRAAAAAVGEYARGGITVVYDGVIGPWFVGDFARLSGLDAVHYAVLLPPEEVCLERVRTRIGHGFSDADATRHMHRDFARSPLDPRHVLAEPWPVSEIVSVLTARVDDGSLLLDHT